MLRLEQFNKVIARFGRFADFVIVYIEEAHPTDGWSFKNNIEIAQHKSLQDRINAARKLKEHKPKCPIVVDNITNDANLQYGGLYERLYIVLNDIIVYEGERGPMGYRVEDIEEWFEKNYC